MGSAAEEESEDPDAAWFSGVMETGDIEAVTQTLVGFALNHDNWRLVYRWCKRLLAEKRLNLRGLPYTCIGHLARLHADFCGQEALDFLTAARLSDPENAGLIDDAIDDIRMFAPDS